MRPAIHGAIRAGVGEDFDPERSHEVVGDARVRRAQDSEHTRRPTQRPHLSVTPENSHTPRIRARVAGCADANLTRAPTNSASVVAPVERWEERIRAKTRLRRAAADRPWVRAVRLEDDAIAVVVTSGSEGRAEALVDGLDLGVRVRVEADRARPVPLPANFA